MAPCAPTPRTRKSKKSAAAMVVPERPAMTPLGSLRMMRDVCVGHHCGDMIYQYFFKLSLSNILIYQLLIYHKYVYIYRERERETHLGKKKLKQIVQ